MAPVAALPSLAGGLGLLLVLGPAAWLGHGWLPAAVALILAFGLGRWRAHAWSSPDTADKYADAIFAGSAWRRWALVGVVVVPGSIAVAVAVRVLAALVVAVPPVLAAIAVWLVVAPLLFGIVGRWGPSRGLSAWVGPVAVAGLGLAATIAAARFEADGPHARGLAYTGPILGIHPFQATAVVIDGYGPFDLPINDYVESDGSRGYDPSALAAALQRDFAAIAELQFADGPARARAAFAGATVEVFTTPALRERLDRPSESETDARLVVRSGGIGWRSRVEFQCPGQPNDPRPASPDPVHERMCSDKYSSEASAGLGVTGRWTGYAEFRGQARLSLAAWLGWPRGEAGAGPGQPVPRSDVWPVLWEQRVWAWLILALVLLATWRAAPDRKNVSHHASHHAVGVVLAAGFCGVATILVGSGGDLQVDMIAAVPPPDTTWQALPWASVLAVALLASGPRWLAGVGLATSSLITWVLAGSLAAWVWAWPALGPGLGPGFVAESTAMLAFEPFVANVGGLLADAAGLALPTAEAVVAAVVAAGMLALLWSALAWVHTTTAPLVPKTSRRWLTLAVVVVAGCLVVSRKTLGGAALVAPAVAMALVAGSTMAWARSRRGGPRLLRSLDQWLMLGLYAWTASDVYAQQPNNFVLAALLVGAVVVAVATIGVLLPPKLASWSRGG